MNYVGRNYKKICMGQIRHIIAQGLDTLPQTESFLLQATYSDERAKIFMMTSSKRL